MAAEVSEGDRSVAEMAVAVPAVPVPAAVPAPTAVAMPLVGPLPPPEAPAVLLPPDESLTHRCANCLTPLTGPFCAACGQHVADYHRSIWRFVAEFFDNFLCWDNRILRTLGPLVRRPGWLTQEFMAGRRVRYVHPLRLFLFTSAICLTLLQYTHHTAGARVHVNKGSAAKPGVSFNIGPPPGDSDEDDADEKKPVASPAPAASAVPAPATSPAAESPTPAASASPAVPTLGQVFKETFKNGKPEDPAAVEKLGRQLDTVGDNLQKKIDAAGGAGAFSERMTNNIQQKLSWVALAMLPIFAVLMRWAFGRNGGYYFTYLVFSLHYHTFLLLFWVAYSWLDAMANSLNRPLFQIPGLLVGLTLLVPPWYLYRAFRQMYGQGRFATATKVCAVGLLHLIALFSGLAIIGATSFL